MKNRHFFAYVVCFIIVCLYKIAFIFQGLDVTDTGWHLTHQLYIFDDVRTGFPLNWIVDSIIAAALSFNPVKGLIGARLLYVVLTGLTAVAALALVIRYTKSKFFAVVIVIATAMIVSSNESVYLADYYTLPSYMNLVFIWCLSKIYNIDKFFSIKFYIYSILIGIFFAIVVFCKLSSFILIIVPFVMIIIQYAMKREFCKFTLEFSKVFYISSFVTFAAIVVAAWRYGLATAYMDEVVGVANVRSTMLKTYDRQILLVSKSMFFLSASLGLAYLTQVKAVFLGSCGRLVLSALIAAAGCLVTLELFPQVYIVTASLSVLMLLCVIAIIVYTPNPSQYSVEFFTLIVMCLFLPFASFIGSSGGIKKWLFSAWLVVPVLVIGLEHALSKNSKIVKYISTIQVRMLVAPIIIVLAFISLWNEVNSTYRDSANRFELISSINHPKLQHIYTTTGRAESVGQVISEIERRVDKGDKIFIYNSAPLLYYITQTKPVIDRNWLVIRNNTEIRTKQIMSEVCTAEESTPVIIVKVNTNTRNRRWGSDNIFEVSDAMKERIQWIENELQRCNPKLVWSNRDFAIFEPIIE